MKESHQNSPKLARRILFWMANRNNNAAILGDAEEEYRWHLQTRGRARAKGRYWGLLFISLPSFVRDMFIWRGIMFKNHLIIALRHFRRHRGFSFINISGLVLGLVCALLIFLWVQDELSYDRYHENAHRIVRVTRRWLNADGAVNLHLGHVAPPIGPLLKNDFPEIEHMARILNGGTVLMEKEGTLFEEERCAFAEDDLFRIFSFHLLEGDAETCLSEPVSMVITRKLGEKYFGAKSPMNQTLRVDFGETAIDFKITGVMETMPRESHFHFDCLMSFVTYSRYAGAEEMESWSSNNYGSYLLLKENIPLERLQNQMDDFIERHYGTGMSTGTQLVLQPLTDIHLHSRLDSEFEANGDMAQVMTFSAIALFVLLIACINFMNLSTARSVRRAREVGLRKVVGARRAQIMRQFLIEAMLISLVSMILAMGVTMLVLPGFNGFIGKTLHVHGLFQPPMIFILAALPLIVGLVAGSYPALYLSAFKPAAVLKKMTASKSRMWSFRSVLVVFQFAVSIILIVAVFCVSGQLRFMQNKRLGLDKEHVVVLPASDYISGHAAEIKSRLLQHPGVEAVSLAKRIPSGRLLDSAGARVTRNNESRLLDFRIANLLVDHDYIPLFKMEMAAGRNFNSALASDSTQAFILNETAVKRIGWDDPAQAVGQPFGYGHREGRIIGVVKDFHFESMRKAIAPIVMLVSTHNLNVVSVRIRPEHMKEILAFLETRWQSWRPGHQFHIRFLDERFNRLYASDQKLHTLFNLFAFLSIFISCLGLLGLASYSVEQRTREIGIRKVLGASVSGVVALLSGELTRWVLAANIIAWPVAWILMNRWLHHFAYHTSMGWLLFFKAALLVGGIALLTVGYQAVKAAVANPVESLRYE